MLNLTRRTGEELILIHGGAVIRILWTEVKKGQSRIGIEAPLDVVIQRGENFDAVEIASQGTTDS